MNTLYDLVTRIDALTANSQQVLNALIRSCVAAGSSSGYRVNKYGVPIELDRADIYHLYDFYQSWQAEGFPSGEKEFNSLLARADERWKVNPDDASKLATEAVVKHAMILYMSKEQGAAITNANTTVSDEIEQNSDFWVAKIRDSATPMGTISSAPIPLNLRTPLYDENLSVKSFSQFETYLFPMGYHRADILGTPGNGDDYIAGGRNWTIDATDFLTLNANHILLGINTNPENKLAAYENKYNTISWGNESYAFGNLSLAFGDHSVAQGDGAIVFGKQCYGIGPDSFIAGGLSDQTVLKNTFATNWMNTAVAPESFAANWNNTAGGWGYVFDFKGSESNAVQTECETDVTYLASEDICISDKKVSEVLSDSSLYKVITISDVQVEYSRMPFDMQVGDTVVIYNLIVKNRGVYIPATEMEGYPANAHETKITNITRVNRENSSDLDHYEITLEKAIPVPNRHGVWVGGTVSLYKRVLDLYDIDGKTVSTYEHYFGARSAVFGHGNAAIGRNQMVVGQMSVPSIDAKFVVGAGSAYIRGEINGQEPYRSNALVIGEHYSYMKLANGKSYIGMSTDLRTVDEKCPTGDRLTLRKGTIMHSSDPDEQIYTSVTTDSGQALMLANKKNEVLARIGVGSSLQPYFTSDYPTAVLQSLQGTAVITSGAYVETTGDDSERLNLVDTLLGESRTIKSRDEHGIAIYAEDGIEIRNTDNHIGMGINIETCSYLTLTFRGLLLHGMTFRSLPATDESTSFILSRKDGYDKTGKLEDVYWGHGTGASGFYFLNGADSNARVFQSATEGTNTAKDRNLYDNTQIHVFNSVARIGDRYHVASLAIPESPTNAWRVTRRPTVTIGYTYGVGGENQGNVQSRQIPYIDDVSIWSSAPASNFGYLKPTDAAPGTSSLVSKWDYPSTNVVMPVFRRFEDGWHNYGYARILSNDASVGATYPYHMQHEMQIFAEGDNMATDEPTASVSVTTSINGNSVDVYGYIHFNKNDGNADWDGFRVAFIPGFATRSSYNKFGIIGNSGGLAHPITNLIYHEKNGYVVSYLSGSGFVNNTKDAGYETLYLDNIRYGGMAMQCGIMTIDIVNRYQSLTTHGVYQWDTTQPYTFHLSGLVPFEATPDCIGMNVDTVWRDALKACYNGKVLCPYSSLLEVLGVLGD